MSKDLDNYSWEDFYRERSQGPRARQLCHGSRRQLMVDAEPTVVCPECLAEFTEFETQRNREQICPVVPGHLPNHEGQMKVQMRKAERKREGSTPRPW